MEVESMIFEWISFYILKQLHNIFCLCYREVLIDDWAVLLKKYESVHGDDIEEQMTDISEIDRLPDLDLGYLDEDVGGRLCWLIRS